MTQKHEITPAKRKAKADQDATGRSGIGKRKEPSHFARLERLHIVTGKTWNQIADELEVDRSMLFHVKAGARNLSPKVIFRLEQAEISAGIAADARVLVEHGLEGKGLAAKLLGEFSQVRGDITVSDVDQGYKELPLEYRRGSAPSGCPSKIRLSTPGNAKVWAIIGASGVIDDPTRLLKACLPRNFSDTDFLDLITPSCYRQLVGIAMGLVFGPAKKERKK